MKKLFLMAAAAAMIFASCSKEETTTPNNDKGNLVIKIVGVNTPQTRTIDSPMEIGAAENDEIGAIELSNGNIFVFDGAGAFLHQEALIVSGSANNARTTGQTLKSGAEDLEVPGGAKVYIIGNLASGEAARLAALSSSKPSASNIMDASYAIINLQGADGDENPKFLTEVPIANANGLAGLTLKTAATESQNATYEATIALKPLLSRLELVAVQAKTTPDNVGTVTEFTVGGVWLDDYYPSFTYGGGYAGTQWFQGQGTTFSGMGDSGNFVASGTPLKAVAAAGKIWGYNVPAGEPTRLIIHLSSVKYLKLGGDDQKATDFETVTNKYLTVGSYDGAATFDRGNIYRVGVTGVNDFEFGPGDITDIPNPSAGTLTVKVTVDEWVLKTPDAILM